MITLIDGPVAGTYLVKRAPQYLRGVFNPITKEKDVLNELEDEPLPAEIVSVYQLQGKTSTVHLLMSPRSKSGWYVMGEYMYLPDVDGQLLREAKAWREWCIARTEGNVNHETGAIDSTLQ